jgi:cytochrome c-type biogenesis protein CcmH
MAAQSLVFILLAIAVVLFVVWPILRRRSLPAFKAHIAEDERLQTNVAVFKEHMRELDASLAEGRVTREEYALLKLEHERRLLDDDAGLAKSSSNNKTLPAVVVLFATAVFLIGGAFYFYQHTGSAVDVEIQKMQQAKNRQDMNNLMQGREPDRERSHELVAALEQRLAQRPDNTQYWFMLARSAMETNDFSRAVTAYRSILELEATSGMVMAELAQALFLQNNNRINPEIAALAGSALTIEPENTTALGLAGIDAYERAAYDEAVNFWQRAVDGLGPQSPGRKALEGGIERARQEAAKSGQTVAARSSAPAAAVDGPSLEVSVEVADKVDAAKDLTVFVYARAWQGAKIPLAIQRVSLASLPAKITLDESMAMAPTATLSQATQVELVARISQDGSAISRAGDWQGSIGPIDLSDIPSDIRIIIDQKLDE